MRTASAEEVRQCLICAVSPVVVAAALTGAAGGWLDIAGPTLSARWLSVHDGDHPGGATTAGRLIVDFAAGSGRPACRLTGQVSVTSMAGGSSLLSLHGRLVPAPSGHAVGRELADLALRAVVTALESALPTGSPDE
ncbi:MAG: hypothetical protein ACYDAC_00685 [Candidatus Dormibacteria bacterium]